MFSFYEFLLVINMIFKAPTTNFSYRSSAAAVVFGGHLSAWAAYRLDRKSPEIRLCV